MWANLGSKQRSAQRNFSTSHLHKYFDLLNLIHIIAIGKNFEPTAIRAVLKTQEQQMFTVLLNDILLDNGLFFQNLLQGASHARWFRWSHLQFPWKKHSCLWETTGNAWFSDKMSLCFCIIIGWIFYCNPL